MLSEYASRKKWDHNFCVIYNLVYVQIHKMWMMYLFMYYLHTRNLTDSQRVRHRWHLETGVSAYRVWMGSKESLPCIASSPCWFPPIAARREKIRLYQNRAGSGSCVWRSAQWPVLCKHLLPSWVKRPPKRCSGSPLRCGALSAL